MKDKIMMFVIGVLVGAIIATGAFFIYSKSTSNANNMQMPGGTPPSMPNSENGTPPEKPSGENGQPPEIPNSNQNSTN